MFKKADLSMIEVGQPFNNWCSSGHIAAKYYKRSGPKSKSEPTRFFRVNCKDFDGIYCEPCLVVANFMAKRKREENGT